MATEPEQPQAPEAPNEAKTRRLEAVNVAADAKTEDGRPDPEKVTPQQAADATAWFMSSDEEDEGWRDVDLNVASTGEKWVRFRVQALPRERIDEIREQNVRTVFRDGKKVEETDQVASNTRISAEGLAIPDLSNPEMRVVRGQKFMDPADALEARFAHKPGLIDQLTGYVLSVSGYNTDDVREVEAGKS
jgi:hypothetical protein